MSAISVAASPRALRAATALAALVLVAGCAAKRDSVIVGSVPDDYRTNHPIVVGEGAEVLDLPVARDDRHMRRFHEVAVDGFVSQYDRSAGSLVTIMIPADSANSVAASAVAHDVAQYLYAKGVPHGRIVTQPYGAGAPDAAAPIRIIYSTLKAQTGKCGRWPDDMLKSADNKHYANFGCSYQNNLAAQIANPADLLGPRAETEIDAENRAAAIEQYQQPPAPWSPETNY